MFENKNGHRAREITYCKKCLMPSSRPRITFDEKGVCNACLHGEKKRGTIDWESRKQEFIAIIEQYRSKDGSWDCVVPWSGGKDSSSVAYKLKYEYGMNPLLVTFSPMMPTDVGHRNREALIQAGFDHLYFRPNQKVHRKLARRFFIERGNPKVPWEAGIFAAPYQVAIQYRINLVFYAEHGESEYGGKIIHKNSAKSQDFAEIIEHLVGDDPRNWVDDEISENDLPGYLYPDFNLMQQADIQTYYFGYFHRWSMFENYHYIKDKIGFNTHPDGRTLGTFTNFDSIDDKIDNLYFYMQYIKFGFGRAVRDACRYIQNGHMTYKEGLELAHKYDGEFPDEHLDEVLTYLNLSKEEFLQIIDRHRNDEIWQKENGGWKLRFPLPEK